MNKPAGALLETRGLYAGYTDRDIIHGIDLEVHRGEIVCVIGPNGAGKSTLFKSIYGFLQPRQGTVHFDGQDITGWSPQRILSAGMAMVPQLPSVFPQMTVRENLELGLYLERDRKRIQRRTREVLRLFPVLADRPSQDAGTLSGGERRMLELARALMIEPELLLLDEPSAGLQPSIVKQIFAEVQRLNTDTGLTVLMIEQNARRGLEASHRGYVLELGENRFEGTGRELLEDREVRRAFLGVA